jgi:hypothetical protein
MMRAILRRPVGRAGCLVLLGAALLAAPGDVLAQGCAMCRTALGGADDPLARGFYWSVLFLMSAPYIVAGSLGAWLAYRVFVRRLPETGLLGDPVACGGESATPEGQGEQGRNWS